MAKQTELVMTDRIIDCPECCAIVHEVMDSDGVRYCGYCHERISDD